jgi:hypothetical protein
LAIEHIYPLVHEFKKAKPPLESLEGISTSFP